MTDTFAIATALRDVAGALVGVKDARVGLNALTSTPAAEVWMRDGTVIQQRASQSQQLLERHQLEVHFYSALRANQDEDEERLARLAREFIEAIHAPDFDETLGGLVETTRCTRYGFDVVERNGHAFRAVVIEIEAGEL